MENLDLRTGNNTPVRAVLFDFDGTISTLRCGWEAIMKPLMLEMIGGAAGYDQALEREVDAYIDESTGIQTIHQMKWLAETAQERGLNLDAPSDPWWYKAEYNRRLMESVDDRLNNLKSGVESPNDYIIAGSIGFLDALKSRNVEMYVASGTDHPDVVNEIAALGLTEYFAYVAGAPVDAESCSKEKVIEQLITDENLNGADFAVVGDGKVEIALGRQANARTIGLASDEVKRSGLNHTKYERLKKAGADIIVGDFSDQDRLFQFLGLQQ